MNQMQKSRITDLRGQGFSYAKIAEAMGLSENSVKSFCQRNHLGGARIPNAELKMKLCRHCAAPLLVTATNKTKQFCSSKCRTTWWNAHHEQRNTGAMKSVACACCGKAFFCYACRPRKYCSHSCYIQDRFKGGGRV